MPQIILGFQSMPQILLGFQSTTQISLGFQSTPQIILGLKFTVHIFLFFPGDKSRHHSVDIEGRHPLFGFPLHRLFSALLEILSHAIAIDRT